MTNYSANMMKIILKIRLHQKVCSEETHSDILKIFTSNLDKNNVPPFMKLFWQEQQKYVPTSRNGVRYHPMLIRFCLNLISKSTEELRYNVKRWNRISHSSPADGDSGF